jgi:hypothetical protein
MQLGLHGVEKQRRVYRRMSWSRLLSSTRLLGATRRRHGQQGKHCDCGCEEGETGRPALRGG